jgi:hypothetical protein
MGRYLDKAKLATRRWSLEQGAPNDSASTFISNKVTDKLLGKLQAGSQWLNAQHEAWLEGRRSATNDERFSATVATSGIRLRGLYFWAGQ